MSGFSRTKELDMSANRTLLTVALLSMALSAQAIAGTMFRLEIGPPVAAGTDKKVLKDGKKTILAVRAVVCDDLANVHVSGTAEGILNGARQSVPLTLTHVDKAEAVYVVSYQWPENGSWVLHLRGSCSSPKAEASTLVPMNKGAFIREKTEVLREPASTKQVEAALTALARSQS
jgi:hypothetical protein